MPLVSDPEKGKLVGLLMLFLRVFFHWDGFGPGSSRQLARTETGVGWVTTHDPPGTDHPGHATTELSDQQSSHLSSQVSPTATFWRLSPSEGGSPSGGHKSGPLRSLYPQLPFSLDSSYHNACESNACKIFKTYMKRKQTKKEGTLIYNNEQTKRFCTSDKYEQSLNWSRPTPGHDPQGLGIALGRSSPR